MIILDFFTLNYWVILKLSIFSRNFDFLYACKISKAMPTRNTNQQIPMVSSIDILQKILLIKISNTFLNKQFFFSRSQFACVSLSLDRAASNNSELFTWDLASETVAPLWKSSNQTILINCYLEDGLWPAAIRQCQ